MKRLSAITFLTSLLLTGCAQSDGEISKDPSEVMPEMHENYINKIVDSLPKTMTGFKFPEKYEAEFNIDMNMEGPQIGNIDINMASVGSADMTDTSNLIGESIFNIDADINLANPIEGISQMDAMVRLLYKLGEGNMLAQLEELEVNSQDFTEEMNAQIEAIKTAYQGKWYGIAQESYFDFFNDIYKAGGIEADFQEMMNVYMQGYAQEVERMKEFMSKIHFWNVTETLPIENGMYRYAVELDKEKIKESMIAYFDYTMNRPGMQMQGAQFEEMKQEVIKDFDENFDVEITGILGVDQENYEYFTFEGTAIGDGENVEISIAYLENEKSFEIRPENDDNVRGEMITEGNRTDFSLKVGNDYENTLMEGYLSEEKFEAQIYDEAEVDNPILLANLDRDGDNYEGTIQFVREGMNIEISNLTLEKENFALHADITGGMGKMGTIDIDKENGKYNGKIESQMMGIAFMFDNVYLNFSEGMSFNIDAQQSGQSMFKMNVDANWSMDEVDNLEVEMPEDFENVEALLESVKAPLMQIMRMSSQY